MFFFKLLIAEFLYIIALPTVSSIVNEFDIEVETKMLIAIGIIAVALIVAIESLVHFIIKRKKKN